MRTLRFVFAISFCLSRATLVVAQTNRPAAFEQLAELTGSDGTQGDFLGYSLAMSSNTIVAGAPQYGNGGVGKAYVFVRPHAGWTNATQIAELTPSDGAPNLGFGYRVAISGDTIVVDAQTGEYVFVKPASGWVNMTETAKLTLRNGNGLGAVAISGNTIAAAASGETIGSNAYQGAIYLFEKPARGWSNGLQPKVRLIASNGQARDFLGISLAFDGSTVVAGAINRAAYVFVKPPSGWVTATETAELTASDETGYDEFGWAATVEGGTIVVGAPEAGSPQAYNGAAYLYTEPLSGWVSAQQTAKLIASDSAAYNFFGTSLAMSANQVAIGANAATVGDYEYEGATYVFDGVSQIAKLTPSPGMANGEMGWSVAASGETVAAGAVYTQVGFNSQQGSVYVFAQ